MTEWICEIRLDESIPLLVENEDHIRDGEAFDSAKNHKRQSVTAKREKSQTPKFV